MATIAVSLGVVTIRIAGGEPTVRKGLVLFLAEPAEIEGLGELVLTTKSSWQSRPPTCAPQGSGGSISALIR